VHYEIEDDGVLPNGATDGGHHDEATMQMQAAHADAAAHANVAVANHM
jgi:hypothetical protein